MDTYIQNPPRGQAGSSLLPKMHETGGRVLVPEEESGRSMEKAVFSRAVAPNTPRGTKSQTQPSQCAPSHEEQPTTIHGSPPTLQARGTKTPKAERQNLRPGRMCTTGDGWT